MQYAPRNPVLSAVTPTRWRSDLLRTHHLSTMDQLLPRCMCFEPSRALAPLHMLQLVALALFIE